MDPFILIVAALALEGLALIYLAALHWPEIHGTHQQAPTTMPLSGHVHEFHLSSTEQTAGRAIQVFHCSSCGQLERREITHPHG